MSNNPFTCIRDKAQALWAEASWPTRIAYCGAAVGLLAAAIGGIVAGSQW